MWVSLGCNQGFGRAVLTLKALGEGPFLASSALEVACTLQFMVFFVFQASNHTTPAPVCHPISFSDSLSPSPILKDPHDSIGPTWGIHGNLPI